MTRARGGADLVVIGATRGGAGSALAILRELRAPRAPIVAAFPCEQDADLPQGVRFALDKEELEPGRVYVAPPGYHLLVEGNHLALSTEPPEGGARPSLDALLESAALAWGGRVTAVILAGEQRDGARGAALVKRVGGTVLVESPDTASHPFLPAEVLGDLPEVDGALPLSALPDAVAARLREGEEARP